MVKGFVFFKEGKIPFVGIEPKDAHTVPFSMNGRVYELKFRIGHNNRLGLLEDLDRKGEMILSLHEDTKRSESNVLSKLP